MRIWTAFLCACAFLASGCAAPGVLAAGFVNARVEAAYVPLHDGGVFSLNRSGAAVVVAPNVAVTNAHNANLLPKGVILAVSDYDLLFFRTEKTEIASLAEPRTGMRVVAYGQSAEGTLREAAGTIRALQDPVAPRCAEATCRMQPAFSYDADAGTGFSGGPVVDAESGEIVGITFALCPTGAPCGQKRMFAFPASVVLAEMRRLNVLVDR